MGAVEAVTPREAEVLAALGSHLTNAQIANQLHLSVRTVESYVASLLRKLGVSNRRDLAELAPEFGSGPALGTGILGVPEPWTSMVGRRDEIAAVLVALDRARLVTLVGPGGVGKTRLAVEVTGAAAPSFPFGGGFAELMPVQPDFVVQAVATTLGVTTQPGIPVEQSVLGHVARRRVLIVLDNCEHVLPAAAAFVANLLAACPEVTVLTTSRERLGIAGERVITVQPLSTDGTESDAARLFFERAQAADPSVTEDSDVVAELCARLDGLPLAIELAAARVGSVGAQALLEATTDRLRLLAGGHGTDQRHRSLRAVLDWSHDLIGEPERRLLRRLGVFANGFDLAAVDSVAGDDGDPAALIDTLGQLVDKSLVVRRSTSAGTARWHLLETVRSYALDQLEASNEADEIRTRHRAWAGSVAADLVRRLDRGRAWADDFDLLADDLRAALALAPPRPDPTSYELARATGQLAFVRGLITEAERHLREAVPRATTPVQAADALQTAGHVAMNDMRTGTAFQRMLDAAEAARGADDALHATCLARAVEFHNRFGAGLDEPVPAERLRSILDEARGLAATDPVASAWVAEAEAFVAANEPDGSDLVLAEAALAEARTTREPALISAAMDAVGGALLGRGRYRDGYRIYRERMDVIARLHPHHPDAAYEIDDAINMVAEAGSATGELRDALSLQRAALAAYDVRTRPAHTSAKIIVNLALTGRFDEAAAAAERMWSAWLASGSPFAGWMGPALVGAALADGLRGDEAAGEEWLRRARDLKPDDDLFRFPHAGAVATFAVARVALHTGDVARARSVIAQYVDDPPEMPGGALSCYDAYPRAFAADVAAIVGSADADRLIESAAPAAVENRWAAACLDRARGRRLGDHDLLERSALGFAEIDARYEVACTLLLLPERVEEGRRLLSELGCSPPA
jgi:predicted ATPase/DNA-binding CsgD family transcriptional regulator